MRKNDERVQNMRFHGYFLLSMFTKQEGTLFYAIRLIKADFLETSWYGVWSASKCSRMNSQTVPWYPSREWTFWCAQKSFSMHSALSAWNQQIDLGHWILSEIAQKHIRIKYCQNWFRFCIIRRNSIMLAAFRGWSWEPIKRSGHSALSESALSECWL